MVSMVVNIYFYYPHNLCILYSTSAKVEIFSLDLGTPGPDMSLVGSLETPNRFAYFRCSQILQQPRIAY